MVQCLPGQEQLCEESAIDAIRVLPSPRSLPPNIDNLDTEKGESIVHLTPESLTPESGEYA